jgi:ribosome-binding factor A
MGNRNLRVNELLKQEVSDFIHRHLRSEAVAVTVTDVETTKDFRSATVFFSLVGDAAQGPAMEALLDQHAQEINQALRRVLTLRNIPRIRFRHDRSMERGARVLRLLDEIDAEQKRRAP